MSKIYNPPKIIKLDNLLFLAGAIQGAEDWQSKVINYLKNYDISIASPRRKYICDNFDYNKQVEWETYYLNVSNIILFWLPKEIEHIEGRSFAQTTRFELGEWLAKSLYIPNKQIIVGIDSSFKGSRYIKKRIQNNYKNVPIFTKLKDCCDFIINKLNLEVEK